jgi:hypothetical protein
MKKKSSQTTSFTKLFLFAAISASLILFSCEKEDRDKAENLCPVILASAVPQIVKDSFSVRYPTITVITWFDKDSIDFCAYFKTINNAEILAEFASNGSFIKEKTETDNDHETEDSMIVNGVKSGKISCECEIHKERD